MCSFCSYVKVKLAHREQNKYINSGIASTSYTLNTVLIVTRYHPDHAKSPVFLSVGGLSMGGDIAVAAAGLDHRVERVAAIIATPDWLRPGMQDLFNPGTVLPPGEPDAYAQYFYDHLNPLTHLAAFVHGPAIKRKKMER